MDYVEAAKLRGEGRRWIIFREILPNALSPLVAEMGLRFIFMQCSSSRPCPSWVWACSPPPPTGAGS